MLKMKESLEKIFREQLNEDFGGFSTQEEYNEYIKSIRSQIDTMKDDPSNEEPESESDGFEITPEDREKYSTRKKENAIEMKKLKLSSDEYIYYKKYGIVPQRLKYGEGNKEDSEGHVKYIGTYKNKYPLIQFARQIDYDMNNVKRYATVKGQSLALMNNSYNNMKTFKKNKDGNLEMVDGFAYTDKAIEMPNGNQLLLIKNFGVPGDEIDKKTGKRFTYNYIESIGTIKSGRGILHIQIPQSQKYGIKKTRPDEFAASGKKTVTDMRRYARSNVTDAVNYAFGDENTIKILNDSFIAEPVGHYKYAEQSSNVRPIAQWGLDEPTIDVQYNSVIGYDQMKGLLELLEYNLKNKRRVNVQFVDSNEKNKLDDLSPEEEIKKSIKGGADYMRRFYAGNIYKDGKWFHHQRVGGKDYYDELGGPTKYRGLNPKGIQGGSIQVSSMSTLNIMGRLVGDKYVVKLLFNTEIVFNPGDKNFGDSFGQVITPITVNYSEIVPESINKEDLMLSDSTKRESVEFIAGPNGVLTTALKKLSDRIKTRAFTQRKEIINHVMDIIEGKAETAEPLQEEQKRLTLSDLINDL